MKTPFIALVLASALAAATPAAAETIEGYAPGADSVRIHFLQAGVADARHTLLLIPGWQTSASIWSAQLDYFSARGYHVIAMDPRSQGGSTVVQSGNAPEDRARDIHAVITALKLTHLTLVGWSQGVQDVAAYVAQYGTGALDALALVDSSVSAGPESVKESPAFVRAILQYMAIYSRDPRAYSDGFMHAIISAPAPAATFTRLEDEFMRTPSDIGISMQMQDMFTVDRRPALKKFDKPTLVIASAQSQELDAQKQMAAALPHGKFAVIQHAAHAVFFDQPVVFDQQLEAFIAGDEVSGVQGSRL
ncbi:MAG: alpha/beta fold hydrolase [Gammaproteobacteria bacterium]